MCGKISPLQRHFSRGFLGTLDEAVGFVLRKHASAEGRCDTREEEVCFPILSWVLPPRFLDLKKVYSPIFQARWWAQRPGLGELGVFMCFYCLGDGSASCLSLHGARHLPCFSWRSCGPATMLRDVIPFIVS